MDGLAYRRPGCGQRLHEPLTTLAGGEAQHRAASGVSEYLPRAPAPNVRAR